jgi:excisionase family DNA binding protein
MNPSAFSIKDFCDQYGIGRTTAYEEIKAGRLKAVKVGRRTLVPVESGQDWLQALPKVGQIPRRAA